MLSLKEGVRLSGLRPELAVACIALHDIYNSLGVAFTITSGIEGKHSMGSGHYRGCAIDVRTRDLSSVQVATVLKRAREQLGLDFLVLQEADHIHVEFKPQNPIAV